MFDIFDPQTITFVMISDVIILKRSFAIRVISEWLILYSILKRSHVISDVIIILKRSYMISDIIILLLIYCSLFISSDDHRSDLGYYEYSMYIYIYILDPQTIIRDLGSYPIYSILKRSWHDLGRTDFVVRAS